VKAASTTLVKVYELLSLDVPSPAVTAPISLSLLFRAEDPFFARRMECVQLVLSLYYFGSSTMF
jgi:hypothetical protein